MTSRARLWETHDPGVVADPPEHVIGKQLGALDRAMWGVSFALRTGERFTTRGHCTSFHIPKPVGEDAGLALEGE